MVKDTNDKFLNLCDRFGEKEIHLLFQKYGLKEDGAIVQNCNTKNFAGNIHNVDELESLCEFARNNNVDLNEKIVPPVFNSLLKSFRNQDDKEEQNDDISIADLFSDKLDEIDDNINELDGKVTEVYKSVINSRSDNELIKKVTHVEEMISHASQTKTSRKAEYEQVKQISMQIERLEKKIMTEIPMKKTGLHAGNSFLLIDKNIVTMKPVVFYFMLFLIVLLSLILILKGGK